MTKQYSRRDFLKRTGGLFGAIETYHLFGGYYTIEEHSDVLHEDAKVVKKSYTPKNLRPKVSTKVGGSGSIGIGGDGAPGISVGGIVLGSELVSEKYEVVFKGQHRTLTVKGSNKKNKDLYERLKEGQEVNLFYREVYQLKYTKENGQKKILEKKVEGYEFIDAQPKKK